MSGVKFADGRLRSVEYVVDDFSVSLVFAWDEFSEIPKSVKVSISEHSRKNNLSITSDSTQRNWATFEEAVIEGRSVAAKLIAERPWVREIGGDGSSQVVHRIKD